MAFWRYDNHCPWQPILAACKSSYFGSELCQECPLSLLTLSCLLVVLCGSAHGLSICRVCSLGCLPRHSFAQVASTFQGVHVRMYALYSVQDDSVNYVCGFRYADGNLVYVPVLYNYGNISCQVEVCKPIGITHNIINSRGWTRHLLTCSCNSENWERVM